jgi:Flp pilus assembly protein TadD
LANTFPKNLDVINALARAQIGAGDVDRAISTYKRAYEIAPTTLGPDRLCRLAEIGSDSFGGA